MEDRLGDRMEEVLSHVRASLSETPLTNTTTTTSNPSAQQTHANGTFSFSSTRFHPHHTVTHSHPPFRVPGPNILTIHPLTAPSGQGPEPIFGGMGYRDGGMEGWGMGGMEGVGDEFVDEGEGRGVEGDLDVEED